MEQEQGFKVIEPGHLYQAHVIDSELGYIDIRFVKRVGKDYPGNNGRAYPGTTMQVLLRIILDRLAYLHQQKPCLQNKFITLFLKLAIWLLEYRAAKRHGLTYFKSLRFTTTAALCKTCGHTVCRQPPNP